MYASAIRPSGSCLVFYKYKYSMASSSGPCYVLNVDESKLCTPSVKIIYLRLVTQELRETGIRAVSH